MEADHTSNLWPYLDVKRSKVKVIKPINAVTVNDTRSAVLRSLISESEIESMFN